MQDELSEYSELPAETGVLAPGSRLATKLLIISDAEGEADANQLFGALGALGMDVTVASADHWPQAVGPQSHDVVLINFISDYARAEALCQALRREEALAGVAIVTRFDSELLADPANQQLWGALRAAGADDLLPLRAYLPEIEVRLDALAGKTQLARDLRRARDEVSRQMQFDEVTQLLNRRFFFKAAHRECARARRYRHSLSCLMVDIDYLVLYNHNFGFACGDYILRTVANMLRQWTRDSDILARFSGTKFVLLLPETSVSGALVSRDKLLQVINDIEFVWQDQRLPVTVSIGEGGRAFGQSRDPATRAVMHSDPTEEDEIELISVREELAELLADADAALYVAKRGARYPAVCVDPGKISIPAVA